MRTPLLTLLLSAAACGSPAADAGGSGAAEGVALFDGATLDGWECFLVEEGVALEDVWSVQDGVLVCEGAPNGYLRSKGEWQDFRLVVEWRWPGEPGNSGVLLRIAGDEQQMLPPCAEAQLRHGNAGDMYGFQDYRISGPEERLSQIRLPGWKLERMADAENPAGAWNRYVITAQGGDVTVELNGTVVNAASDCDVRAGNIGLQSEGGVVHFRTVHLTPLGDA